MVKKEDPVIEHENVHTYYKNKRFLWPSRDLNSLRAMEKVWKRTKAKKT